MSIYSDLKELYKDTNDIVNGKNIAWKIIYMLQNISFIIICMICLVDKCKIRTIIPENIEFGLSQRVCNFLNKYIVICIIFYFDSIFRSFHDCLTHSFYALVILL